MTSRYASAAALTMRRIAARSSSRQRRIIAPARSASEQPPTPWRRARAIGVEDLGQLRLVEQVVERVGALLEFQLHLVGMEREHGEEADLAATDRERLETVGGNHRRCDECSAQLRVVRIAFRRI